MLDVYMIKSDSLLVARPKGVVNINTATALIEFVEIKEKLEETGFNRFCDMTRIKGIHLSCAEVLRLAARRREFNPNDIRVKSAFLATNPLVFGIARMYEQLLNSPRIKVRVWTEMQAAGDWLGIEPAKLKF